MIIRKIKIKYHCKDCNKEISKWGYFYGTGYCKRCGYKLRNSKGKNNSNWKGGKPKCKDCSKQLKSYNAKRCRSCESKQQAKIRKIPANYKDGRCSKKYYCIDCEKQINFCTALYGQGRCNKCANKKSVILRMKNRRSYKGKGNSNWQNGISKIPYTFEFTNELRQKIRKRDNYICQGENCSMTEEEHIIVYGIVLCVHHIDYDKENCNEDNLTSLCCQCNSRVNFNRKYWKEYFQKKVKQ